MSTCYNHPDKPLATYCEECTLPICLDDRRIRVIDGKETMLCPDCFELTKNSFNTRYIGMIMNAVFTFGVAAVILFL
ncbi:MAG: hypothetical protein ACXAE3_17845 [Candidatus Kariarchaeaceae archaeon]|jgi:hypothetical protein